MLFRNLNRRLASTKGEPYTALDSDMLLRATDDAYSSDVPKHPMGAVIYRGKHILGRGSNKLKTHPIQHKWCPRTAHIHAETSALLNAFRSHMTADLQGASIAVARVRKTKLQCTAEHVSYPCDECLGMLSHLGFVSIMCRDEYGVAKRINLMGVSYGN
jgi:tRNA(Arg) A34 adenosine deaminase TadA